MTNGEWGDPLSCFVRRRFIISDKKKQTNAKQTEEIVSVIAEKLAEEQGVKLWDVRFEKIGGNYFLTVVIDKPEKVGIEDCEKFSRAIDGLLDEADPVSESYCLEVSSPGMNRELRKPQHFEYAQGKLVKVSLYKPSDGEKEFIAELLSYDKTSVTVKSDESERVLDRKDISKISLYDEDEYLGK